jgi:hypothetical protein
MTRRSVAQSVIATALEKARLAYGRGNEEMAVAAIRQAFRDRPKSTLADDAGIGDLGLEDEACELLRSVSLKELSDEEIAIGAQPGFETIGELRRVGFSRLVQLLRTHSPERLAAYAQRRKWQAGTTSDVATRLARDVRVSMQSFNVRLTRRGAKG